MGLAEASPAKIEETLLVARPELLEIRSRKVHTFVKPSEYEEFISRIGRNSVSSVLRDLVLEFNRRNVAESDS